MFISLMHRIMHALIVLCEINCNIQRQAENSPFISEDFGLTHYASMPNKVGIKI